ncbi:hypothetical protein GCM10010234_20230 [Streptomyces hawaiiensis]
MRAAARARTRISVPPTVPPLYAAEVPPAEGPAAQAPAVAVRVLPVRVRPVPGPSAQEPP